MLLTSGASLAWCVAGAISAGALASTAAVGCASRELMKPEPASLSLSGGSVQSASSALPAKSAAPLSSAPVAAEADAAARPELEVQRDRGILGADAGP